MKRKKWVTCALIIICLLLGCCLGCGKDEGPVGKKVTFKQDIVIQGSSGSFLVNLVAKELMQSKYVATYSGVIESVLGDSYKVSITSCAVDMLASNGRTSVAQHENMPQAKKIASDMIGKSLVVEKAQVAISR